MTDYRLCTTCADLYPEDTTTCPVCGMATVEYTIRGAS